MPYMFPDIPGMNVDGVRARPGINQNAGVRQLGRTPYSSLTAPNTVANLDPARAPRESLAGRRSRQYINRTARPSSMGPGRNLGINMEGFGRTLRPSSMGPGRNLGINMEGFGSTRSCPSRPRRQPADVSFW